MVNKADIAQAFDMSVQQFVDSIRYRRISGTIDDAAVLVAGGTATIAVFRAPYNCRLMSCIVRAETLETAGGTIDLKKAASGTALSSGQAMITSVVPTTAGGMTAATDYECVIDTDHDDLIEGDTVALVIGTVGEMTGLIYDLKIKRLN